MESKPVHWEVSKEDAVVKPVEGQRNRRREKNLAMDHGQKMKEETRGYCRSRKRVTVAGRRMTRCAKVAWGKRNSVRKERTRKQVERGIWRGQMLREKVRTHYESRKGLKDLGGGWP
jgi:hypothetical protein